MTAIIISILAALGIGGGFVIANNGGSSGGGTAVVQIKGEKTDYIAQVNPNFELISAITDTEQYQPSIGNEDTFFNEYQASALHNHVVGTDGDYEGYGDPADDLRNGQIRGEQIEGTPYYATLNLLKGIGIFWVTSLKVDSIDNNGFFQNTVQAFDLRALNLTASNSRYKTFTKTDTVIYSPNNQVSFHHYNSVHLGGASLGLSVADFGHWDEKAWTENGVSKQLIMHNSKTFFFYDERFAYKNMYYKNTATMQGNVFVSVLVDHQSVDTAYNLQTGSISMDLNLASRKITNGQVIMDDANYTQYNVENFTGSINGSVFRIDGTFWQGQPRQEGLLNGGVGKLLVGANGLEMVGNFTKQIQGNTESGKADYTFGAKEIN